MFRRPSRPALAAGVIALLSLSSLAGPGRAQELPADEAGAAERLNASPRHGEWVTYDAGGGDEVTAWVVHPERSGPAPVVVVIHEIYGLTDWIRGVADQAAAAGYIAIAPDLLSGHGPEGGNSSSMDRQGVVAAIRGVLRADVNRRLQAAAEYAMALPSAAPRVASVGFCWGGSSSFEFAVAYGDLAGAVVYYGGAPAAESLTSVQAPVLGLYGGNDERVNASIPGAREAMDRLGKTYEPIVYEGAGHGFLRQLDGQEGANLRAAQQAWPRTLEFFREVLGG